MIGAVERNTVAKLALYIPLIAGINLHKLNYKLYRKTNIRVVIDYVRDTDSVNTYCEKILLEREVLIRCLTNGYLQLFSLLIL